MTKQSNTDDAADDPLLDRRDLKRRFPHLPTSASHLRRMTAMGFPAAIPITERRRVWRLSAVLAYIARKETEGAERAKLAAAKAAGAAKANVAGKKNSKRKAGR